MSSVSPERRTLETGFTVAAIIVVVAVVGSCCGLAGTTGPDAFPWPAAGAVLIGLPVLGLAYFIHGWPTRLLMLALVAGVPGGMVVTRFDQLIVPGSVLFGLGLALIPPTVMMIARNGIRRDFRWKEGQQWWGRPLKRRSIVLACTISLPAVLFGFGLTGVMERDSFHFVQEYGTPVVVTTENCSAITNIRNAKSNRMECRATWHVDRTPVQGTFRRALDAATGRPINAMAYGRVSYHKSYGERYDGTEGRYRQLGLVPAWLMLPLPAVLITLIVVALIRKGRRSGGRA